jgi:uncharacterized membrane protein YqjE
MTLRNPSGAGLSGSLRSLGANLLALIGNRAALIAVELQEEKTRAGQKLELEVLAALFLCMGLLLAAFFVVVLFWDTHRLIAAGGVALFYLGIGACALARLREARRNSPPPFAATLKEFMNDLRLLRGHDE